MTDAPAMPVLDLLHPDLVNGDGNLVKGPSQPGLFAARETLPFHTNGIFIGDERWAAESATPESLEAFKTWAKHCSEKLEKAVRIVSQRDIGSDLLSAAYRRNTHLNLDTTLRVYPACYHAASDMVKIDPEVSLADMVLMLVHEIEHAAHSKNKLDFEPEDSLTLKIKKSRITEPAARVAVAIFVHQVPESPYWDGLQSQLMEAYERSDPYMAVQAKKFAYLVERKDWIDFAQEMFAAASRDLHNIAFYDKNFIGLALDNLCSLTDVPFKDRLTLVEGTKGRLLADQTSLPENITDKIQFMGKSYVNPKLLTKPEFTELPLNNQVMQLYGEFYTRAEELNDLYGLKIDANLPRPGFKMMARCFEFDRLSALFQTPEGMPVDVPEYDMKMGARHTAKIMKLKVTGRI